jgi:serine/threonine protein kinase, bacterial
MRQPEHGRHGRNHLSGAGRAAVAAAVVTLAFLPAAAPGQIVTTLAGSGTLGNDDGTGTAASFNYPTGVAVDATGNVYVADTDNHKIRKITPAGIVTTLAGSGSPGAQDGAGTAATFRSPYGVAVDAGGNVYVADTGNNRIRWIAPGGAVTTFAGSGSPGSQDGTGAAASFRMPTGVAVDASGNVYVSDTDNGKIRKITPGGVVTTLAGSGAWGSADGAGAAASFKGPYGVAVNGGGDVFVADMFNNTIRKIAAGGVVTTLAGSGAQGHADGSGTAASFSWPSGVAVGAGGDVYVADLANYRIRKVTPAGGVTTYAGSGAPGNVNGPASAASFGAPSGVAADASGGLYVTDYAFHTVRKIASPGGSCAPDASTACLVAGRYRVTSHWRNQYAGGEVRTLSATRLTDATAAFWTSNAATYEYLIRISTATDNGRAWIAIPTFTDVEFWIAVTDTVSGQSFEYHSPAGNRTLVYDPTFFVYP